MPDLALVGFSIAALQLVNKESTLAGLLGEVGGGRTDQSIGNFLAVIDKKVVPRRPARESGPQACAPTLILGRCHRRRK